MAYENIQFEEQHVAIVDGHFYSFDYSTNMLRKCTNDGQIIFFYIIEELLGTQIKRVEYDGVYFWTLQNGSISGYDIVIRKWKIEEYACILKDTISLVGGASNRYDSDAFAIEHYKTYFSTITPKNSDYVEFKDYGINTIITGDKLFLGPNKNNEYETVTVNEIISENKVKLTFYTLYEYEEDDPIHIVKNIWLFNNYNGVDTVGALYKIDIYTKSIVDVFIDTEYKNINACTFSRITEISSMGDIHALIYVKSLNLKFMNIYEDPFSFYCTMLMDNLKSNEVTVIDIYDIVIANESVYRLQNEATYFGLDYLWSTYNYQLSPLRNFVESISVSAFPKILPNTGVNLSKITAICKDQYFDPIKYKPVIFTEDDDYGFMTIPIMYTSEEGVSISYYNAGLEDRVVTIDATITQYD